jgi:hypothetical protein
MKRRAPPTIHGWGRSEIVKETQRVNFLRMLSAPDRLALIDPMNLLGRAYRIHEDFSNL